MTSFDKIIFTLLGAYAAMYLVLSWIGGIPLW